jgi:hypothetical protein
MSQKNQDVKSQITIAKSEEKSTNITIPTISENDTKSKPDTSQLPTDDSKGSLSRDRFIEASSDIMIHIFDKVVALTRQPVFQERLQNILDPLVQHVINRVFPYIILSSILFLIMLLVTVSTFIIVVRGSIMAIRSVDMAMKTGVPENWT